MLPEGCDPAVFASPHLKWSELACVNRLGYPFEHIPPGALIAPYPLDWRASRGRMLGRIFEAVREIAGHPLVVNSAYRTRAYNALVGGAGNSMHLFGRAIDLALPPDDLDAVWREVRRRAIDHAPIFSEIGGIGKGAAFLHLDNRFRTSQGRIVEWTY